MELKEFARKFKSKKLWGNLAAMLVIVILMLLSLRTCADWYTNHGEVVCVPDVYHKQLVDARKLIEDNDLEVIVVDSGYDKKLPADCILDQKPAAGSKVKPGRVVYLVVNSSSSPTASLPDIIENCSYREAQAKLVALGFKVGMPQFVEGEKDWVYGVLVNGRSVYTGDKISLDQPIVMQIGAGMKDDGLEEITLDDMDDEIEEEILLDDTGVEDVIIEEIEFDE